MSVVQIPFKQLVFGNEHWLSYRAIDEIEIYCDLIENLHSRIDSLLACGKDEDKDEQVAIPNVQAVMSSYALEIAMKSFWALDHPAKCVPHEHDLTKIYDGLKEETKKSLEQFNLTRELLEYWPRPFVANRYSMECSDRRITVYRAQFLRSLAEVLRDKIEESRKTLFQPPHALDN
ncbi:MAG: hypothetical protein F4X34_02925 [Chloroflexi bacterium]|nr:hypothetical protein [Chloroflexota bacterium]